MSIPPGKYDLPISYHKNAEIATVTKISFAIFFPLVYHTDTMITQGDPL
jgi:hypothetical protein